MRALVWLDNAQFVKQKNAEENGVTYKLNRFADMVRKRTNRNLIFRLIVAASSTSENSSIFLYLDTYKSNSIKPIGFMKYKLEHTKR